MNKIPMIKTITDLRYRPKEILAHIENEPVVISQNGTGVGVLVSIEQWNALQAELENLRDILAAYQAEIQLSQDRNIAEDIDLDQMKAQLQHAKVST